MAANDRSDKLAGAFHFSPADLTLNKQGTIAESQKSRLEMFRRGRVISLVAFGVMLAIFLLACAGAGMWALLKPDGGTLRIALPLATGLGLLFMGGGAANFFLRSRDVVMGTVSQVDGIARLTRREYRSVDFGPAGVGWFLRLGSKEFRLTDEEQHAALEEGRTYRVYYVKNYPIDVVLSVEPVPA